MDSDEFKGLWAIIESMAQTAQYIEIEDVEALIATANRADSIMPILDPTAWIKGRDNLADQHQLARATYAHE